MSRKAEPDYEFDADWSELDAMIDEKYGRTPQRKNAAPSVLAYNADFPDGAPQRYVPPAGADAASGSAQPDAFFQYAPPDLGESGYAADYSAYDRGAEYNAYDAGYSDPSSGGAEYYAEDDAQTPPQKQKKRKKRRKRHILRNILLSLLLLLALCVGIALLAQKQPKTDEPIAARRNGCSTILLVGTDESGGNTDTLMLLFLDRKQGSIHLLSIPRDTYVTSPYTGSGRKINSVYALNGGGEEGMDALMDYVACCIGYRPDGYVLVSLTLFKDMVELMGGIEYDVPCDMYYNDPSQDLYIDLKAGKQTLNAEQAMGLVRMRHCYSTQDLGRVETQRGFIKAAIRQWVSLLNAPKLPSALRLMRRHATTDLSSRNFLWLAFTLLKCGTDDMQSYTLPGAWDGRYYRLDLQQCAEILDNYFNPYQTEIRASDLRANG